MRSILDVFSKTWFINVILVGCVAFFGAKSIGVWVAGGGMQPVQAVSEKTKKWHIKKVTREPMPPETTYEAVTDRDLFSKDRVESVEEVKAETEVEADAEEEPVPVQEDIRISGRKIVLYGVIIRDDYKIALISDPKPKSAKRPSMWVKEGDIIGESAAGIIVSSIQKERITLRDDEKMYEVLLYDKDKPRGKVVARKEEKPTVVTTQPTVVPKRPTVNKTRRTPVAQPPAPKTQPGSNTVLSAPPGFTTNRGSTPKNGQYKTVNTPFGTVKVREK